MRNVLVIAGPGGEAFGKKEIDLLTTNIQQDDSRKMSCVGNGVEQIKNEDIANKLEVISHNENPTTIIIEMHGTEKQGQFYFINGDSYISSKELFEIIKSKFKNKSVDILITSCHSGACLHDKDLLPEGSVIGALSQGHESTAGSDVNRFMEAIQGTTEDLTTYNLLKLYLSKLQTRIPPELGISGKEGTLQLDELLRTSIGKKIDRSKVIGLLQESMSLDELESLIAKIETSRDEWGIYAAEYGKAINVCSANEFGKELNSENFRPMAKSSRVMSTSSAFGFFESTFRQSTPVRRKTALDWTTSMLAHDRAYTKDEDGKEVY